MKIQSHYFQALGSIRDVHLVTRRDLEAREQWIVCIWRDRFGQYNVQARLRWFYVGPARQAAPEGVLVPANEPHSFKSLSQARERARRLMLVLGHAMGCRMRDHNGREITIGFECDNTARR